MAVDTRNKRFSLLGLVSAVRIVMPNPDASLAAVDDRAQMSYQYAGALAAPATPTGPGAVGSFLSVMRRRYRRLS